MDHKKILLDSFVETQKLISMYKEYKKIESACEKEEDVYIRQTLDNKLQEISDAMKFDNPVIWMMYKHHAYINTPNPILTVGAFIEHCNGHGDICSKRYTYLSKYLKNLHQVQIETQYTTDTPLEKLYTDNIILNLIFDVTFMDEWSKHEYNTIKGKTAKWKSYTDQGSSSCPCCN